MSQPTDRSPGLRLAAAALFALSTAACTDYVERRETIAAHAGNAVAANRAIHTIDPWPPGSSRTEIEVSGRRVVDAIDRYEAPAARWRRGSAGDHGDPDDDAGRLARRELKRSASSPEGRPDARRRLATFDDPAHRAGYGLPQRHRRRRRRHPCRLGDDRAGERRAGGEARRDRRCRGHRRRHRSAPPREPDRPPGHHHALLSAAPR